MKYVLLVLGSLLCASSMAPVMAKTDSSTIEVSAARTLGFGNDLTTWVEGFGMCKTGSGPSQLKVLVQEKAKETEQVQAHNVLVDETIGKIKEQAGEIEGKKTQLKKAITALTVTSRVGAQNSDFMTQYRAERNQLEKVAAKYEQPMTVINEYLEEPLDLKKDPSVMSIQRGIKKAGEELENLDSAHKSLVGTSKKTFIDVLFKTNKSASQVELAEEERFDLPKHGVTPDNADKVLKSFKPTEGAVYSWDSKSPKPTQAANCISSKAAKEAGFMSAEDYSRTQAAVASTRSTSSQSQDPALRAMDNLISQSQQMAATTTDPVVRIASENFARAWGNARQNYQSGLASAQAGGSSGGSGGGSSPWMAKTQALIDAERSRASSANADGWAQQLLQRAEDQRQTIAEAHEKYRNSVPQLEVIDSASLWLRGGPDYIAMLPGVDCDTNGSCRPNPNYWKQQEAGYRSKVSEWLNQAKDVTEYGGLASGSVSSVKSVVQDTKPGNKSIEDIRESRKKFYVRRGNEEGDQFNKAWQRLDQIHQIAAKAAEELDMNGHEAQQATSALFRNDWSYTKMDQKLNELGLPAGSEKRQKLLDMVANY